MDGLRPWITPRFARCAEWALWWVELKGHSAPYLAALAEQGVLALPAGATVMRFLPPLVISEQDIDTVIQKVGLVLGS